MSRTLSMNVATSRIATTKGASVAKSQPVPSTAVDRRPPARTQAPVKSSRQAPAQESTLSEWAGAIRESRQQATKQERVRVLAYACIQPNCRSKHKLCEWSADDKATTHFCTTCGSLMATAVVYMPPIDAQMERAAERAAPIEAQEPGTTVGAHEPGSRSDRMLKALEKKMRRMVQEGIKFTDEQVERSADLREAANAWLLVTTNKRQYVVDLKQRPEGQRSHKQLRGALNFWRADVAREMGVEYA